MLKLNVLFKDDFIKIDLRGSTMKDRRITKYEQSCISNCINKYWGDPGVEDNGDDEKRDREYMQCLEDCQICG